MCPIRLFSFFEYQMHHSPVGNCEEANLVSKIPAPSINASRIPPMAADPTMATGPSTEEQETFTLTRRFNWYVDN